MRSRSKSQKQNRRRRFSSPKTKRRKSRTKNLSRSRSRRRLRLSAGRKRSLAADVATGVGVTAAVGVSAFTAVTAAKKLKQLQEEYVQNFKTGFSALVESPESFLNNFNLNPLEEDLLERRFDKCLTFLGRITKHNDAFSIFRKYVWLDKNTQNKLMDYMSKTMLTKDLERIKKIVDAIVNFEKNFFEIQTRRNPINPSEASDNLEKTLPTNVKKLVDGTLVVNSLPKDVLDFFGISPILQTVLVTRTPFNSPTFNDLKKHISKKVSELREFVKNFSLKE